MPGAKGLFRQVCLLLSGAAALISCAGTGTEPEETCDSLIGFTFIELQPPPSGLLVHYQISAGGSLQLLPAVHRVDAAQRSFNPQQGWSCVISASSPTTGAVSLTTNNTGVIRLDPGGWVRGLSPGYATVTAASPAAPATVDISVQVIP